MNPSRGALLKPSERNGKKSTSFSRTRNVSRYEILKHEIKSWWDDRLKVGNALLEIRDQKLYHGEYPTFEEFCETEYGFKRAHAYRLIEFADVKASVQMSPIGDKLTRESQSRALAPVPPERRVAVLEKAVSGNGKVTAKTITAVAKEVKEKAEAKAKHYDKTGYIIPDSIFSDWREAEAMDDLLKQLHRIKLRVENALEQKELVFREITNSTVADLKNAWSALQGLIPYAVCPTCAGHNRKDCTLCKQRGFLSKFAYEHLVPKKTREVREANAES